MKIFTYVLSSARSILLLALCITPVQCVDVWYQDLEAAGDDTPWGTLCVIGGQCRSFIHTALNVKPSTPLSTVFGASEVSLDEGATWIPNKQAVTESHLVFDNTTQVFTCNWDWLLKQGENPPNKVCIRGWFMEVITGEYVEFEPWCMVLNVTFVDQNSLLASNFPSSTEGNSKTRASVQSGKTNFTYPVTTNARNRGNTMTSRVNLYFGNVTIACSDTTFFCDVMIHAAFLAATKDVVTPLTGSGEISVNHGDTWFPTGEVTFLSYFDILDEMSFQRWHFGSQQHQTYSFDELSLPDSEICYRVWFTDLLTFEAGYANMSSDVSTYSGYARNAVTRCWPISFIILLS